MSPRELARPFYFSSGKTLFLALSVSLWIHVAIRIYSSELKYLQIRTPRRIGSEYVYERNASDWISGFNDDGMIYQNKTSRIKFTVYVPKIHGSSYYFYNLCVVEEKRLSFVPRDNNTVSSWLCAVCSENKYICRTRVLALSLSGFYGKFHG